jgi:hypothetical protein
MKPSQRRPVYAVVAGRPDLKRFIGFEGDPGITVTKRPTSQSTRPMLRHGTRVQGLGSLGVTDRHTGFPMPDGSPGSGFTAEYDERFVWGTDNSNQGVVAPTDPSTGVEPLTGPQQFDPGLSIPFGVSYIPWRNPTTMQSVPIIASTPVNTPVLSLNMYRNSLIIQNNSIATSPDIAPTFYIGFNAQPQQGLSLALAPGAGLLFDIITPRDAVYVLIAGGAGASQVIQGVVVQGTYAPI